MACENKWQEKGLYRIFSGKTTGDEVIFSNHVVQSDSRFAEINYVINDFTKITEFIVGKIDIQNIAMNDNVASNNKPTLKIAIIAIFEPILEWIHLYIEMMQGSSYQCCLFASVDDAYQWVSQEC